MATVLPPPTVDVTPATDRDASAPAGSVDVVVHRDGRGRSYRIDPGTTTEMVKSGIEKVLADPYSGEWIPKP